MLKILRKLQKERPISDILRRLVLSRVCCKDVDLHDPPVPRVPEPLAAETPPQSLII